MSVCSHTTHGSSAEEEITMEAHSIVSPGQPSRGNGQKIKQGEAEKKGKESHMTTKIPARALL